MSAHVEFGDLLLDVLPELLAETIIVSVLITPARICERGYDHMLMIARYVAKARGLKCEQLLRRKTNTKQRQSSAKQREIQAKRAFEVRGELDASVPYLIIDDVITTGATIKYSSQTLRDAGAEHVWIVVIARQTLS